MCKVYLTLCKLCFMIIFRINTLLFCFAGGYMKLENIIRKLRFEKNEMSQQQLADLIGVSRMTIYSIEKGKYVPSTVLALKISQVFKRSVEEIFSLIEEKEVEK